MTKQKRRLVMKTNWLMMKSAILMALFGVIAVFLPQELVVYFGSKPDTFVVIIVQIAGALYLGFAFLNYYSRSKMIGGIYSRPIVIANLVHFTIVALMLLKELLNGLSFELVVGALIYTVFALWFGFVMYSNPLKNEN